MAAVGSLLLPLNPATCLQAAAPETRFLTSGDRAVLRTLAAYGADVYLSGGSIFARAAGLAKTTGPVNVLVLVRDYRKLDAFLRSPALKELGKIWASGNTLSFTYRGTDYVVTNQGAADFYQTVSRMPASSAAGDKQAELVSLLNFQNLLYHPATDTVLDPGLSLESRKIELAGQPAGSLKTQFQTLVEGWLAAKRYDLPLGESFLEFQSTLLAFAPTPKAAESVARVLTRNLTALALLYDVEGLRPLLSSRLVAGSLKGVFGLDAGAAIQKVIGLREDAAHRACPDASLWLAVLFSPEITDGTIGKWLENAEGSGDAASRKALEEARRLVAAGIGG